MRSSKIISIFYDYYVKLILSVFVPGFQLDNDVRNRREIIDKINHYMNHPDMGNCFAAYCRDIYPKLLPIIDRIESNVTEKNQRKQVKILKENIKNFLKVYEPSPDTLPIIDIQTETFPPANLREMQEEDHPPE